MSHQHAGLMRLAAVAPTMTSVRSQKLSDHAKLWESFEVLPQVDKFENYIMNAELGVESAMSKNSAFGPSGNIRITVNLLQAVSKTT